MTRAVVDPGICGMTATIEVNSIGKFKIKVEISSECTKIARIGTSLSDLSLRDALKPHVHSAVYACASESNLCPSCPVPVSILKAIEIETGLALPRPVHIEFEVTEHEQK